MTRRKPATSDNPASCSTSEEHRSGLSPENMELAKSRNELNKKRWYRLLKVAFVLSFVLAQTTGILLVRSKTEGKVIAPISLRLVGRTLKEDMPAYRGMSDEQAGREVYHKDPVLWAHFVEKYEKKYVIHPVARYRQYSELQRAQFCTIAFLLITLFFEVLRRSFYYVIFGKVFPRKRRRKRMRNRTESPETH